MVRGCGDGRRGSPYQELRWRCHGHISCSQLEQPLELLLLLWFAVTSSSVMLKMEGKQVGKHEASKPVAFCCHCAALNCRCGLENPSFSSLFVSYDDQVTLASKNAFLQHGDIFACCINAIAWLKLAALLCLVAEAESRWDQLVQSTTTHLPKGLGYWELKLLHWLPISF